MRATIDFGIDLGTSNSAIAVQDGAPATLAPGGGRQRSPALGDPRSRRRPTDHRRGGGRRSASADPANTAIEFKRQMGTGETTPFPASGRSFSSVELSAEILRVLVRTGRAVRGRPIAGGGDHRPGHVPARPVRGDPAGGGPGRDRARPAASGTDRRGHRPFGGRPRPRRPLAGLRSRRRARSTSRSCRARAGRLQVLDHDGDNHLGGKDFNRLLARWAAERIREEGRLGEFRRTDPALAAAFARLASEAERVRVRLSEQEQETFTVADLARTPAGEPVDVNLTVDRDLLESLIAPTVLRTTALCKGLLARNRLTAAELKGIVLVGGPTRTPYVPLIFWNASLVWKPGTRWTRPRSSPPAPPCLRPPRNGLRPCDRVGPADGAVVAGARIRVDDDQPEPAPGGSGGHRGADGVAGLRGPRRRRDDQFDSGPVAVQAASTFTMPLDAAQGRAERLPDRGRRGSGEPAVRAVLRSRSCTV